MLTGQRRAKVRGPVAIVTARRRRTWRPSRKPRENRSDGSDLRQQSDLRLPRPPESAVGGPGKYEGLRGLPRAVPRYDPVGGLTG